MWSLYQRILFKFAKIASKQEGKLLNLLLLKLYGEDDVINNLEIYYKFQGK